MPSPGVLSLRRAPKGRRSASRARGDERGASLIEFALVLPLLALFLFAIVDFGMVFGGFTSMRSGVQSAARMASVNEYSNYSGTCGASDPTSQMVCTTVSAMGSLLSVQSGTVKVGICFLQSGVSCSSETSTLNGNQCISGVSPTTYCQVIICAAGTVTSTTGLTAPFLNGRVISSASTVRLELGNGTTTTYGAFNASSGSVSYNSVAVKGMNCS
jgi:Flp pilus assembly protein TadG